VVAGLDVGLEVERTVAERREQSLEVSDAAVAASGAAGRQHSRHVSRTAHVPVVSTSAPVQ